MMIAKRIFTEEMLEEELKEKEISARINHQIDLLYETHKMDWLASKNVWIPGIEQPLLFVAFHQTGTYMFLKKNQEISDPELLEELKCEMNLVSSYIEEDVDFCYMFLYNPNLETEKVYFYDKDLNFLVPVEDLIKTIESRFDNQLNFELSEELCAKMGRGYARIMGEKTSSPSLENKIFYEDETGSYIKRRGSWHKLSADVVADTYFLFLIFGGIFGLHKLYARKAGAFFAYLFTLGFCGVGVVFDILEVFLGVARDRNHLYIGPIYKKKEKVLFLAVAIFVYAIVFGCLVFFARTFLFA